MVSASIPRADMDALVRQMDRAEKLIGKSVRESVAWAGNYVAISLGAITKVSKKKRKVEQRPDNKWKTDARVGRWGTYKYKNGQKYWVPIYRTGEYGRIYFKSKKSARMLTWDQRSGDVQPIEYTTGAKPEDDMPGIMQSKKLIIGRRGLAKRSWKYLKARMRVGGAISDHGTGNIGAVIWRDIGGVNPTLIINNDLRYAMTALKGDASALSGAVGKAARNMERELTRRIEKVAK